MCVFVFVFNKKKHSIKKSILMCKTGEKNDNVNVTLEMKRRYKRNWYVSNTKRVAEHTRRYWAKRLKINKGEQKKKKQIR